MKDAIGNPIAKGDMVVVGRSTLAEVVRAQITEVKTLTQPPMAVLTVQFSIPILPNGVVMGVTAIKDPDDQPKLVP